MRSTLTLNRKEFVDIFNGVSAIYHRIFVDPNFKSRLYIECKGDLQNQLKQKLNIKFDIDGMFKITTGKINIFIITGHGIENLCDNVGMKGIAHRKPIFTDSESVYSIRVDLDKYKTHPEADFCNDLFIHIFDFFSSYDKEYNYEKFLEQSRFVGIIAMTAAFIITHRTLERSAIKDKIEKLGNETSYNMVYISQSGNIPLLKYSEHLGFDDIILDKYEELEREVYN